MKKLLINGEVFNEAERIVVDRSTGAIICKADVQPTGTIANEYKERGGQIFS